MVANFVSLAKNSHYAQGQGFEVSSQHPCELCGRERYCFQIADDAEEVYKILCHWTDPSTPPRGWLHVGTARDRRPIFVKEGYRRSKRSKNSRYPDLVKLTPDQKLKADVPAWQDVHIPLSELSIGHTVRLKPKAPGSSALYKVINIYSQKYNGQFTLMCDLHRVGGFGYGKTVIPKDDIAEIITFDPETGAKEQFIEYTYSETQKVIRHQWTDRRPVYDGQTKKVRPFYRDSEGNWHCGKGKAGFPLYRQEEVEAAIRSGKIIFAVAGEQVVECLRLIGLSASSNQGGEGSFRQIAQELAPIFKEVLQPQSVDAESAEEIDDSCNPLLVIWPDNDETGKRAGEDLLKECYKLGIPAVIINPEMLHPELPDKGDAKDWSEKCSSLSMSETDILRLLEIAIDEAIAFQELDGQHRWQRANWKAAISYKGEIGFWRKDKDNSSYWEPMCNFDFQIEREIEDSFGGGLVLQVKRSFEKRQYRVILNSCDYTKPDVFTDALKRAMGVGVVCNLSKPQLNALMNARLHEYRTTRQGKLFKRIDRYGQQEDGTWVFSDRQYTSKGERTSEEETGWIFNPNLGKNDFIPCPELAPEDPNVLKVLVNAARRFYGVKNIYQVLLTMGWTVAGLHYREIFQNYKFFPLLNNHGEPGSCKTLASETALSLVGVNWPSNGMLGRVSVSAIYEHGSKTGSLPFIWDDPERNIENEELAKTWYNAKARIVRGNKQEPHSPMGISSNHVFGGDQAATYTRFIRNPYERATDGDKLAFQELQQAQIKASGAFPSLIKIGFDPVAILAIEQELLPHLPLAHLRIAQSLAIVIYYAQKIVELSKGTEDIKKWAIEHLCSNENDANNAGDSLLDFIDKILALESESAIGDWNLRRDVERDGKKYVAIHYSDVWSLIDQEFHPATYNLKSLKSLVTKAGGVTNTSVRFSKSKDEVLAYRRALLSPRMSDGEEILPKSPEIIPRKAWLLPAELFNSPGDGSDDGDRGGGSNSPPPLPSPAPVTGVAECNQDVVTTSNSDFVSTSASLSDSCNYVTKKEEREREEILVPTPTPNNNKEQRSKSFDYSSYTVTGTAQTLVDQELETVTKNSQIQKTRAVTEDNASLKIPSERSGLG